MITKDILKQVFVSHVCSWRNETAPIDLLIARGDNVINSDTSLL